MYIMHNVHNAHFFIAKLRPSPSSAKLAWLSFILISSRYVAADPPDMWQQITQICGGRSTRYVAADQPDMWQQIRKSIFLSSPAKNVCQILSFGLEGKTLCIPGSLSEPNQTLIYFGPKIARLCLAEIAIVLFRLKFPFVHIA